MAPTHQLSPEIDRMISQQPAADTSGSTAQRGALGYLSRAAHQSGGIPSSPESVLTRRLGREPSLSPIRRIPRSDFETSIISSQSSDSDANLVVIENPDGSLLEGMPSGFKHMTPNVSIPATPRTMNFATTGIDLINLFNKHMRVFMTMLLMAVFVDAIILTEEFTTVVGGIVLMQKGPSGSFKWSAHLNDVLPFMESASSKAGSSDTNLRHTFSVFPPHWQFNWALTTACLDLVVCFLFFISGFFAYVSKQRKTFAWFSTIACGALVWQVILSCIDKLSLLLFLFRLACFTHARFMGDLMDDIALLATLVGVRVPVEAPILQTEQTSVRQAADRVQAYNSIT